jgi:molybdate-binding protein/DNA-binding transcriptional regulator YhcF (GntR family)
MPNKYSAHLYLQIAESVRRRIASGDLKPGDKLEPVRDMAQQWACTPGTVQRAYAALARDGLVVGQRGRGTRVAPFSAPLIPPTLNWAALVNRSERFLLECLGDGHDVEQIETALALAVARWQALQAGVDSISETESKTPAAKLCFVGSHEPMVDMLLHLLGERRPPVSFTTAYQGSLGGLFALARGEADFAGAHLWDEESDSYNLPFVRRVLPGRRIILLTLVHRKLGLILPPGNPQQVNALDDLKAPQIVFANRQRGSGTRVWLEAQLRRIGVDPASIAGFDSEHPTHFGVAERIARGEATAGLGIYTAAASYGLDFIPLTLEQYDLVIPASLWERDEMQAIAAVIRSPSLRKAAEPLGGYDLAQAGAETWID